MVRTTEARLILRADRRLPRPDELPLPKRFCAAEMSKQCANLFTGRARTPLGFPAENVTAGLVRIRRFIGDMYTGIVDNSDLVGTHRLILRRGTVSK